MQRIRRFGRRASVVVAVTTEEQEEEERKKNRLKRKCSSIRTTAVADRDGREHVDPN